jgi:hypothetical protein
MQKLFIKVDDEVFCEAYFLTFYYFLIERKN